jgi:DNA polymerase-4
VTDHRIIAHLDMDAFYASVELLQRPELRGRPVVIGGMHTTVRLGDYAGRGVITTATYEARALGVHSGMGLMKAARLAPDAVLLPVNFDQYRHYSRLFKAAVRDIAPLVEDRGIDEIYIDLTTLVPEGEGRWQAARVLGERMRAAVQSATGLSCSVGITPNKLLSKIASDLDKPGGLTVLTHDQVEARIWPLPAQRINGIGPKATERLTALGIDTIGDLARTDLALLITHFGAHTGGWLHRSAHGLDDRPVVTESEIKSVSRETTFDRDLHAAHDRTALSRIFTDLCERLSDDLVRKGVAGKTIGIKLRFGDFKTVTRDQTLATPTQDAQLIRRTAGTCLKRVALDRRIRLLGVRVGALVPAQFPGEDGAEFRLL